MLQSPAQERVVEGYCSHLEVSQPQGAPGPRWVGVSRHISTYQNTPCPPKRTLDY